MSGPRSRLGSVLAVLEEFFGPAQAGKGRYFLSAGYRWGDAAGLYYEADATSEKQHAVVDLPGGALAPLSNRERLRLICCLSEHGFACTRLDIALDFFGSGIPLLAMMRESCERGELCRCRRYEVDRAMSGGEVILDMVRLGSRGKNGSGRFIRCYDKSLEQKSGDVGTWVRWELEIADSCAAEAGRELVMSEDWERTARALCLGAVDFRAVTGSRELSRRPRVEWFEQLINGGELLQVKAERDQPDLVRWVRWIKRCVAPQLATLSAVSEKEVGDLLESLVGQTEPTLRQLDRDVARQFLSEFGIERATAYERIIGIATREGAGGPDSDSS